MYFLSSLLVFFLVSCLVLFYHLFFWNTVVVPVGFRGWLSSFECGFSSSCVAECYFSYTYFILLVFFVVFDLEISLLLNVPYSLCYIKNCPYYLSFLLMLGVGYGAELYSGYVRWSY